MARRKTEPAKNGPTKKPSLAKPRAQVKQDLLERIDIGRMLQTSQIHSKDELDKARSKQGKWHSYNTEYLSRCFDVQAISDSYSSISGWGTLRINSTERQRISGFREGIDTQITELESIVEKLELIPEPAPKAQGSVTASSRDRSNSKSVFIVHGHDEAAKTSVARFVEKLGLDAIILHEQPNKGQTIIEKFESNAEGVGFAVVLLSPDDIAASKGSPDETSLRARQNVILELGYFCGTLGRDKVCVLYKEGVEIPSDYLGVVYTELDDSDGWQLKLAKEMKEAGLDVDLNDVL